MEIRMIKGKRYGLVLLRVETTIDLEDFGKPDTVTILRDEQVAELSTEEHKNRFYTAWLPLEAI